jgi:hypothetical protein
MRRNSIDGGKHDSHERDDWGRGGSNCEVGRGFHFPPRRGSAFAEASADKTESTPNRQQATQKHTPPVGHPSLEGILFA